MAPYPQRLELTNLTALYLSNNPLSGVVPSTLSNLTNLEHLLLHNTALTSSPNPIVGNKPVVQNYFLSLWGPQAFRYLKYGIAITKKRQDTTSTTTTSAASTEYTSQPFFTYLTRCEDATDHILSFLDPLNYGVERK